MLRRANIINITNQTDKEKPNQKANLLNIKTSWLKNHISNKRMTYTTLINFFIYSH